MKVLVQKREATLYFGTAESWTSNAADALDFQNTLRALDFLETSRIGDAQIVLKFEDERYDIRLNLMAGSTRGIPAKAQVV
jgi:hypothetical protein